MRLSISKDLCGILGKALICANEFNHKNFIDMVLLVAVVVGLIGGYLRARLSGRQYRTVNIKLIGLVFLAYLPQFFAFYLPATRSLLPNAWVPYILVVSQALLLIFAWANRKLPGFWLLGLGLLSNFTVILLNGGLMPLQPQIAQQLTLPGSESLLKEGKRVGFGKDILLKKEDTILWFLGDIFMLPSFLNYPLAFSIGDIFIGVGAFWLLWQLGGPHHIYEEVSP